MSTQIHTYLTFNGNCREAMQFYQHCLGGELVLQTIHDSPMASRLPQAMQQCILHASLSRGNWLLMGSDMVGEEGLKKGNAVSLMLDCASEEELQHCFTALSLEGRQHHPVEKSFWGALFGDLTDRYGNHWLLHYKLP